MALKIEGSPVLFYSKPINADTEWIDRTKALFSNKDINDTEVLKQISDYAFIGGKVKFYDKILETFTTEKVAYKNKDLSTYYIKNAKPVIVEKAIVFKPDLSNIKNLQNQLFAEDNSVLETFIKDPLVEDTFIILPKELKINLFIITKDPAKYAISFDYTLIKINTKENVSESTSLDILNDILNEAPLQIGTDKKEEVDKPTKSKDSNESNTILDQYLNGTVDGDESTFKVIFATDINTAQITAENETIHSTSEDNSEQYGEFRIIYF